MIDIDEIVAALKRSSAPTLIVEGKDDFASFVEFETENVEWGFTILPVKGRENVERIMEETPNIRHPALAFLLDQDCDIFTGRPQHLTRQDAFFTDGYSIENDLLRDGSIDRLLKPNEREAFSQELQEICRFFACAAACHVAQTEGHPLSCHPHQLFGEGSTLKSPFAEWAAASEGSLTAAFKIVSEDPFRYLRGKTLLALFSRHLSKPGRPSQFSALNLMEIGAAARGHFSKRIENAILDYFRIMGVAPLEHPTAGHNLQ